MDANKRREITEKAARIAIENPNLSMRELARRVGGTTSTTLKKFFDEILPSYYPQINEQLEKARIEHKKRSEEEKYLNSAAHRKELRLLKKVEESTAIANYIVENHATLKDAATKFNKPIARVQRGINAIRRTDNEMAEKLDKVFVENKENYYKKLGEITKERIDAYREEAKDEKSK